MGNSNQRRSNRAEKFTGKTSGPIEVELTELYDGDTGWFKVKTSDIIQNDYVLFNVRMKGFNAPELKPRGLSKEEKELESKAAQIVRDRMEEKLKKGKITIHFHGKDPYSRLIGEIYVDGESISEWMITNGYGKEYNGKGKAPKFVNDERHRIIANDKTKPIEVPKR